MKNHATIVFRQNYSRTTVLLLVIGLQLFALPALAKNKQMLNAADLLGVWSGHFTGVTTKSVADANGNLPNALIASSTPSKKFFPMN